MRKFMVYGIMVLSWGQDVLPSSNHHGKRSTMPAAVFRMSNATSRYTAFGRPSLRVLKAMREIQPEILIRIRRFRRTV